MGIIISLNDNLAKKYIYCVHCKKPYISRLLSIFDKIAIYERLSKITLLYCVHNSNYMFLSLSIVSFIALFINPFTLSPVS